MPVPPADLFNNASTSTAPTTALELDLEKPLTVTRDSFLQGEPNTMFLSACSLLLMTINIISSQAKSRSTRGSSSKKTSTSK